MGIPLVAGRAFAERDNENAPNMVAVNQSMARHFFGNASPLGRRIRFASQNRTVAAEIVYLVQDVQHRGARNGPSPMFYTPALQGPGPWPVFALRATGDPAGLIGTLRRELQSMQSGLTVQDPATIAEQVNVSLARERLVAAISGVFGGIALLLACIGIYGTMAYNVARRTAEVGIRMTLGSRRGAVVWMILREALFLVFAGFVVGSLAARGVTKWIASLLFGLQPGDLTPMAPPAECLSLRPLPPGCLPGAPLPSIP
jgi:hypothetical protein